MSIDVFLSQLRKVKKTGPGKWSACCPAHDDRSPSLGIKQNDDGRILLHCFGGCSVTDIVESVGMSLDQLFPPREVSEKGAKRSARPFFGNEAMKLLEHELTIAEIGTEALVKGITLNSDDANRLAKALGNIKDGLAYAKS